MTGLNIYNEKSLEDISVALITKTSFKTEITTKILKRYRVNIKIIYKNKILEKLNNYY